MINRCALVPCETNPSQKLRIDNRVLTTGYVHRLSRILDLHHHHSQHTSRAGAFACVQIDTVSVLLQSHYLGHNILPLRLQTARGVVCGCGYINIYVNDFRGSLDPLTGQHVEGHSSQHDWNDGDTLRDRHVLDALMSLSVRLYATGDTPNGVIVATAYEEVLAQLFARPISLPIRITGPVCRANPVPAFVEYRLVRIEILIKVSLRLKDIRIYVHLVFSSLDYRFHIP